MDIRGRVRLCHEQAVRLREQEQEGQGARKRDSVVRRGKTLLPRRRGARTHYLRKLPALRQQGFPHSADKLRPQRRNDCKNNPRSRRGYSQLLLQQARYLQKEESSRAGKGRINQK